METLSLIYGRNYCSIAYVIRPDKPPGWDPAVDATTDYERLMYQLPLAGVAFEQDNEHVFSLIQLAVVQMAAETWIYDAAAARDGRAAMAALRLHYEGEAELDLRATKAQQELDTLVYTNERTLAFETMITRLNKAYNVQKKHGQEFTDKSKVDQLAKRIKNPTNNVSISVAVEAMRQAHGNNYNAAVQFITARVAQINASTVNAPGPNPRRISEGNVDNSGAPRTEFNGVDIRNPFRTFTEREQFLLGQRGLAVIDELKESRRNSGGGGRGNRGRGRGYGGCNHGGYGRGGRGYNNRYSRGGGRSNHNSGNDNGANANSGGGNRNVNEASSGGRAGANEQPQQPSNASSAGSSLTQSQASTSGERGGQNGTRFGSNRP